MKVKLSEAIKLIEKHTGKRVVLKEDKEVDFFGALRSMGLSSDDASDVSDYIEKTIKENYYSKKQVKELFEKFTREVLNTNAPSAYTISWGRDVKPWVYKNV